MHGKCFAKQDKPGITGEVWGRGGMNMTYACTHTQTRTHKPKEPIWIWSTLPYHFIEHWNAWMKMDRISWNVIQRRLLVIAGPHLGFHVHCHFLTQRASGGFKCDGFYVPLIPLEGEITRDAKNEPGIHGHAFCRCPKSRSRSLWPAARPFFNSTDQYVIEQSPIKVKYSGHAS